MIVNISEVKPGTWIWFWNKNNLCYGIVESWTSEKYPNKIAVGFDYATYYLPKFASVIPTKGGLLKAIKPSRDEAEVIIKRELEVEASVAKGKWCVEED